MAQTEYVHMTPDDAISVINTWRRSKSSSELEHLVNEIRAHARSFQGQHERWVSGVEVSEAETAVAAFTENVQASRPSKLASFLDGFALAGFLGRLAIPGSPTQVFEDLEDSTSWRRQIELRIGDKILLIDAE